MSNIPKPRLELERYVSKLEGQLVAARYALDLLKSAEDAELQPSDDLRIPTPEALMRVERRRRCSGDGIPQLKGPMECIRDAVRKMGSTFTNKDVEVHLASIGIRINAQRITSSLWKLAKEQGELVLTRPGRGGVPPIYQKRERRTDQQKGA